MKRFTFGFSPCPNDTFMFYALVEKKIDSGGFTFEFVIEDVETLNELSIARKLDISKVSTNAYYYLQRDYQFLRCGAAFGYGCGPIIVTNHQNIFRSEGIIKIAVPGHLTTAFLLLKLFLQKAFPEKSINYNFMPFNEIMPSILEKKVDAGVVIHEGRFTYRNYGLHKLIDLGEWWEEETGLPLPLGGLIAKRELGNDTIKIIEDIIIKSIEYSFNNPKENKSFVKKHSQELTDEVIDKHISLYVNSYSLNITEEGWGALKELLRRADQLRESEK